MYQNSLFSTAMKVENVAFSAGDLKSIAPRDQDKVMRVRFATK
jgi:hypothetical protein